jgi:hypothetical protein
MVLYGPLPNFPLDPFLKNASQKSPPEGGLMFFVRSNCFRAARPK